MDGTRTARLIAIGSTLALGLTLTTGALLATAQHPGPDLARGVAAARTPIVLRTGGPAPTAAIVVPRTTPPPTYPLTTTPPARPFVPSAATTVEHS